MYTIHIFGIINVDFYYNVRYWRKTRFPNSAVKRYFFFSCCQEFFQSFPICIFCHYFNTLPEKISASSAKSNMYFLLSFFLHYHPQNSPIMRMVKIDTFLIVDHRIVDTETHQIHYQLY